MPVCYEGGDHITAVTADPTVLCRLGLVGRKFFLGVGVDSANKNIATVVAAFHKAKLGDTLLVLDRRQGPAKCSVRSTRSNPTTCARSDSFRIPSCARLYEHALALVFPSFYEGFGLPPIEAMTCGCPVIISEQPALMEVCGDAALRCRADDAGQIMRHMQNALHADAGLRDRLCGGGAASARNGFTWAATARSLLDRLPCARRKTGGVT